MGEHNQQFAFTWIRLGKFMDIHKDQLQNEYDELSSK